MRVALIGATGLTGRSLVPLLAADHQLHLLTRRATGLDARETIAPMEEWPARLGGDPVDVADIGVDRLDILRPGLLRGPRGGDRRRGERIGVALSPLTNLVMRGRLNRFAAIDATTVAAAMVALVGAPREGRFVHHNPEIRALVG